MSELKQELFLFYFLVAMITHSAVLPDCLLDVGYKALLLALKGLGYHEHLILWKITSLSFFSGNSSRRFLYASGVRTVI